MSHCCRDFQRIYSPSLNYFNFSGPSSFQSFSFSKFPDSFNFSQLPEFLSIPKQLLSGAFSHIHQLELWDSIASAFLVFFRVDSDAYIPFLLFYFIFSFNISRFPQFPPNSLQFSLVYLLFTILDFFTCRFLRLRSPCSNQSKFQNTAYNNFYFIIPSSFLIIQTPCFTIIQIQRFSVFSFPVHVVHMSTVPQAQSTAPLSTMVKSFNALLDSGCTHHIVRDRTLFHDYVEKSFSVRTANCGSLDALGTGDVEFRYPFGDRYVIFTLRGCLYAPTAPINLLSIGVLVERGMSCLFSPGGITTVFYPDTHPKLPGLTFSATVTNRLSYLLLNFIPPTVPSVPVNPVAFPTAAVPASRSAFLPSSHRKANSSPKKNSKLQLSCS